MYAREDCANPDPTFGPLPVQASFSLSSYLTRNFPLLATEAQAMLQL